MNNLKLENSFKTKQNKSFTVSVKNQKGQLIVEAVLLMLITLAVATTVTKFLKDSEFVSSLTFKPWETLSGMVECGSWSPCGRGKPGIHPNKVARNLSLKPTE